MCLDQHLKIILCDNIIYKRVKLSCIIIIPLRYSLMLFIKLNKYEGGSHTQEESNHSSQGGPSPPPLLIFKRETDLFTVPPLSRQNQSTPPPFLSDVFSNILWVYYRLFVCLIALWAGIRFVCLFVLGYGATPQSWQRLDEAPHLRGWTSSDYCQ